MVIKFSVTESFSRLENLIFMIRDIKFGKQELKCLFLKLPGAESV